MEDSDHDSVVELDLDASLPEASPAVANGATPLQPRHVQHLQLEHSDQSEESGTSDAMEVSLYFWDFASFSFLFSLITINY